MALRRVLVVSLVLILGALAHAEAGVSMLSLGGRVYIDAASLAAHLDAKLERTPERLYLRSRGHLVTLTRGWARVEVDGKAVVLDAPVRVEQERWLVPEAFTRQVLPMIGTTPPARASDPPRPAAPTVKAIDPPRPAAPAVKPMESRRPVTQSVAAKPPESAVVAASPAKAPESTAAAVSAVKVPQPVAAVVPPAKAPEPSAAAVPVVKAPQPVAGPVPVVKAPQPAAVAGSQGPVIESLRTTVSATMPTVPSRATASSAMVIESPSVAAPSVKPIESARAAPPAVRALEPPVAATPAAPAPPVRVIEAPRAVTPSAAKVSEPAPAAAAKGIEAPRQPAPTVRVIEAPKGPASAAPKLAVAVPAAKDAVSAATLEDLRLRSYPTFTRVVLETSAMVRHRVEVVTPKELRIRLSSLSASRRAEEVRDGLVEDVQLEPTEGDAVLRVTFTGASQEPKVSTLSDPPRLLFDFGRAPEPGPRTPSVGAPGPLRTLVLDAGHGGHDSGAVGPAGLMEKDLVLDVTRRVGALVEARLPGIRVLLSRKSDYFVPLRERTSYANRERADLFVSIHANAHREAASEGVETYFLSSEATDNASRQVAAAENSVVRLEKPSARGGRADVVKAILWDLAQSGFQQESSRLAEVVQDSMTQSLKIPNRGVKQAGFYVLGGAAMPAVLVEIGFVTNPKEERKLKESSYRDEIALAIFAGIAEYKQDLDRRASRAAAR